MKKPTILLYAALALVAYSTHAESNTKRYFLIAEFNDALDFGVSSNTGEPFTSYTLRRLIPDRTSCLAQLRDLQSYEKQLGAEMYRQSAEFARVDCIEQTTFTNCDVGFMLCTVSNTIGEPIFYHIFNTWNVGRHRIPNSFRHSDRAYIATQTVFFTESNGSGDTVAVSQGIFDRQANSELRRFQTCRDLASFIASDEVATQMKLPQGASFTVDCITVDSEGFYTIDHGLGAVYNQE